MNFRFVETSNLAKLCCTKRKGKAFLKTSGPNSIIKEKIIFIIMILTITAI